MNRNESKYFNTAIRMDEALITLLEKKDFDYISIKEICEEAGVNRSTFYLHYENTADLLKETTRYILDKHMTYYAYDADDITNRFEHVKKSDLVFIKEKYVVPYLTFIKENQRLFKVAIKQFSTMNLDAVYGRMFRHVFDPILERFDVPIERRSYIMKFYMGGIFSIVMEWLDKDCIDEIAEVTRIIMDCALGDRKIDG